MRGLELGARGLRAGEQDNFEGYYVTKVGSTGRTDCQ